MTLNFSPCSIFPASSPANDDFASMRDRSTEGVGNPYGFDWEINDLYDSGMDRAWADMSGSPDPIPNDILDVLPSDPFGMDMNTTFTAAIAGWIEDLATNPGDYDPGLGCEGNYDLVAGLNYLWDRALLFSSESQLNSGDAFDGWVEDSSEPSGCEAQGGGFVSVLDVDDLPSPSGADEAWAFDCHAEEVAVHVEESCIDGYERIQHEGLILSLGYLGVQDLLSVERVCRSLCSAVQNDPLLWRCIHIDPPLSERITDDTLLQLTQRAQGSLQCLSLVGCSRITDDGLKHVLEYNPRLMKLSVPGCVRLSVQGLIDSLKAFKSRGMPGIKHLKIGGLYGVTEEHFEELKLLLGVNQLQPPKAHKTRFYHGGLSSLHCDDECAIDIEMCPGCQKLKLVYDCPAESCQGSQLCRACEVCIARCIQCGRCIKDREYVETFCLDYLCSGCWKQPSNSQERQEE